METQAKVPLPRGTIGHLTVLGVRMVLAEGVSALACVDSAWAQALVVANPGGSGRGSSREAIYMANANPGPDEMFGEAADDASNARERLRGGMASRAATGVKIRARLNGGPEGQPLARSRRTTGPALRLGKTGR